MKNRTWVEWVALAVMALVGGLLAAGCAEKKLSGLMVPNQPPTVTLTSAPIDTTDQYFYVARVNWLGFDADGRVEYFEYVVVDTIATPDTLTVYHRIAKNDTTFLFRSTRPEVISAAGTRMTDLHTFFIRAVDNDGARSPWVWRTFYSYTIAPSVRIQAPFPSELIINKVPPSIFIQWLGDDFDGEFNKKPLKYKFKLFNAADPAIDLLNLLLLNQYAPGFAGWDSVGGDTTFKLYTDLVPQQDYVFVVTGYDEAGAYDPVFSRYTNVLRFRVTLAGTLGPIITMFNEFIDYTYQSGGYATDDSRRVRVEVPAGQKIRWNWFATPPEGALTRRTRWKLDDVVELTDETARTNEQTDLVHWSQWQSLGQVRDDALSIELPNFPGTACDDTTSESHTLYIEVEDNIGLRSLGILEFLVVRPCFDEKRMLIVDDRRGLPDGFRGTAPNLIVNPPLGTWPTEAELDTFFFAVGNVPWKGYSPANCPAGFTNCPTTQLNSPPGVFAGYAFDTVDTRLRLVDLTFPLSTLARYRHVVWYIDPNSASAPLSNGPLHDQLPLTSLVWMNQPNRANTLSIFSKQGGKLFMFGGGVVMGTVYGWTNPILGFIWKADGPRPALQPGRFMYDFLKMQSEVTSLQGSEVRVDSAAGLTAPWSGLSRLRLKRLRDPLPPYRSTGQIPSATTLEHVTQSLFVLEDRDPNPNVVNEVSVLDTLFTAHGSGIQTQKSPCGFYYKSAMDPPLHGEIIFLGFDLWSWTRNEIIQNVDLFLGVVWGLPRQPIQREPAYLTARSRPRE